MKFKDYTNSFDPEDIEENKVLALFSYIGILFLIPFFTVRKSPYARFHINQGIILFITSIILNVTIAITVWPLYVIHLSFLAAIIKSLNLVPAVVMVFGIINAVRGKAIEIPFIGGIRIIK